MLFECSTGKRSYTMIACWQCRLIAALQLADLSNCIEAGVISDYMPCALLHLRVLQLSLLLDALFGQAGLLLQILLLHGCRMSMLTDILTLWVSK